MAEGDSGMVSKLIFGIAGVIILVIISYLIISTLMDADLLGTGFTNVSIVTNETGWLNGTDYQLGVYGTGQGTYNSSRGGFTIQGIWNWTSNLMALDSANYTVSSSGLLSNLIAVPSYEAVLINYTYTYTNPDGSIENQASNNMKSNFTTGIDNVSEKLPTILLIAAVVLLFGVIVFLVIQSRSLGLGGTQGSL